MTAAVIDEASEDVPSRRRLRPLVTEALSAPTGPDLVSQLTTVMRRGDLSAREWVEVAVGWKRMVSFAHAGQLAAVAGFDQAMSDDPSAAMRPGRTDPVRPTADELAPALGIAPKAASALVALTRRVEDRLPAAADALAEGRMDLTQLKILERTVRDLPAGTARTVEAAAIRWAPRRTAQQLAGDLAAEAARLDADYASTAAARGVAERDVTCRRSPLPGCGRLVLDLPLISRDAAWHAANTFAKNAKKRGTRPDGTVESRTLAQLRADLFAAVLTGQVDPQGAAVPTPQELARLAGVQVVVAHDTLTGACDLPAHLPSRGPIDPETVRDLVRRSPIRRLVADAETGTLLHRDDDTQAPTPSSGRRDEVGGAVALATDPRLARLLTDPVQASYIDDGRRYRPSSQLRDHVLTRDATCLGPACSHPATETQVDHTINHGERDRNGVLGLTTEGNLGGLCERIHNAKTHGGWALEQPAPGAFVWTSPTGRVYHRRARPLVPGWRHRHQRPQPRGRPPPSPPSTG